MRILTRGELADLLGPAFGPSGATRTTLVETAQRAGSHPRVIDVLLHLPVQCYPDMQALWNHLPEETNV